MSKKVIFAKLVEPTDADFEELADAVIAEGGNGDDDDEGDE